MISVSEAFATLGKSPPEPIALTADELRAVAKLEAVIDSVISDPVKFGGVPPEAGFRLQFKEVISPKVAQALQRKYARGSWRVFFSGSDGTCTISLAPMAPESAPSTPTLPPVAVSCAPASSVRSRLLVRMATRGRPAQALSVLQKYRSMAGCPVAIEVVIDEDDETMLAAEVQQRLVALGCTITVGRSAGKIAAFNVGCVDEWDVLLPASDDMCPIVSNYGGRILAAMDTYWPHLDGALYFDDGYQGKKCCTIPFIGRRMYDQFGGVYAPEYKSLFCDQEQTDLWSAMGRLVYVDEKIIEHRHPATGLANGDGVYRKNDSFWAVDKATYETRKGMQLSHAQFVFGSPPLWLSICIATLPSRRAQLDRLLDHIYRQITPAFSREVEVVIDAGDGTVGQKRQRLLERARGHFVAFVDDDDWVSHDYCSRIVWALRGDPAVDCVRLCGVMTTAGSAPETFENSLKHRAWSDEGGVHLRSPTHLSPVRRELALKVGFADLNHGEDLDYSRRLYPLLKVEAESGNRPLYLYFYQPAKTEGALPK